jgi:predicted enzyme related to lactoylglutathione lyase
VGLRFEHVTFDCADAAGLARFWAAALGWDVGPDASADFAAVGGPNRPRETPGLLFLRVDEPKTAKNRFHPDLVADDLDAEVARLAGVGATTIAERSGFGTRWVTMADPEGNEFDVVQARTG